MTTKYKEEGSGYFSEYELLSDSILIKKGEAFGARFTKEIFFSQLRPNQEKILDRDYNFSPWLLGPTIFAIIIALYFMAMMEAGKYQIYFAFFVIASAVSSVVFFRPKIEYTGFSNHTGFLEIQIAKRGKQINFYEEFVAELTNKIISANQVGEQIDPRRFLPRPDSSQ